MQGYRTDITISQSDNVKKLLTPTETILYTFDVVPLDYKIIDYSSPRFYITSSKLIFAFDEGIEVFELQVLDISLIGEQPKFKMRNFILENPTSYNELNQKEFEKYKQMEGLTRISINEPRQVPKYFLVRNGFSIQKSYKTWALMRILNNVKHGINNNELLLEMMNGYFSNFNQKTLLTFIFTFLGYVVLKLVFGLLLPKIAGTILDVFFFLIIIFVGYWLYVSVEKNLKKYEQHYLSYSNVN